MECVSLHPRRQITFISQFFLENSFATTTPKNINKITFSNNFSKSLSSSMQHISHFLKCHLPSFFWYVGTKKSASCLFLMPTCITVLHQCCMASVLWSISPTFYEGICANILYSSEITKEEVFEQMNFERYTSQSPSLKYVIQPTSLTAQITRDMSLQPLRKRNRPRLRVNSTLKEFHLHVDDEQVKYVSKIVRHVNINSNRDIAVRPRDLSYGSLNNSADMFLRILLFLFLSTSNLTWPKCFP